ncbi:MAG: hypothetical protein R3C53_16225 [Pirellulaceae bacterium]
MSWDVTFYLFEDGVPRVPDEEGEICGNSIGNHEELKTLLAKTLPIDWEDSGWGTLSSPDFTIEFNFPSDLQTIDSVTLHIHEPEFAMHAVHELATRNKWHVFDHQEGKYIDIDSLTFVAADEEELEDINDEDEFTETQRRPQLKEMRYL